MERNSCSSDSSYTVHTKDEPECFFNQQEKTEVVVKVEHIKEEAEWEDSEASYDVSEAPAPSNLFTDHEVYREFVLGLEGLQPPDVAFTLYAQALVKRQHKVKDCVVMLERIDLDKRRPSTATVTHSSRRRPAGHAILTSRVANNTDLPHEYSDTNTEKEWFVCAICDWKFNQKSRLMEHVMVHIYQSMEEESSVEIVLSAETADDCDSHYYDHEYAKIESPLPIVQKPLNSFECGTCNKKYTELGQFKRHERTHSRVKPYSSPMVDITVTDSEEEIDVVSLGPQIPFVIPCESPPPAPGARRRLRTPHTRRRKWFPSTGPSSLRARRRRRVPSGSDSDTHMARRDSHNHRERFRRDRLRNLFRELREQVPKIKNKDNASKILILREATALCHNLREEQNCLRTRQHKLMTKFRKLRSMAKRV